MAEYIYRLDEKHTPISGTIQLGNCLCTDEEIIRCCDCKKADKDAWKCNHHCHGYWDEMLQADVVVRSDINPDGFCAWAERDA